MVTDSSATRPVSEMPDQDWSVMCASGRRRQVIDPETGWLTTVEPEDTWRLGRHSGHYGYGDVPVDLVYGLDERTGGDL